MANRDYVLAVKSESTNAVRAIYVSINDTGRTVLVRQDSRYDAGDASDFNGLTVNLYNVTTTPRSTYNVGALWSELDGDGHTFNVVNDEEIRLDVGVLRAGQAVTRGTPVPAGSSAPVNTPARDVAGSAEIAEDGWLRPVGAQVDDWDLSFRPLVAPTDGYQPRYTTREEVRTILRAADNRTAGWEANFGVRLTRAIETAEMGIDAVLGRSFDAPVRGTRTFFANSSLGLITDDMHIADISSPGVTVSVNEQTIDADRYVLQGPWSLARKVYNKIRPLASMLFFTKGTPVVVTASWGWPSVPADVSNYAGQYAADIMRADAYRAGLLEAEGALMYARTPGKDMLLRLGMYKSHRAI